MKLLADTDVMISIIDMRDHGSNLQCRLRYTYGGWEATIGGGIEDKIIFFSGGPDATVSDLIERIQHWKDSQ